MASDELNWRSQASCRHMDPETWFPTPGETMKRDLAVRICRDCPVQQQCGEHAIRNLIPYGVWGGLTQKQRSTLIGTNSRRFPNEHVVRAQRQLR